MESSDYIYGLRAIIEAIREGRAIDKLFIKKDLHNLKLGTKNKPEP